MKTGSKLLDKKPKEIKPNTTTAARRIVGLSNQIIQSNLQFVNQIKNIIDRHGHDKIIKEFTKAEAQDLMALYNSVKNVVVQHAPEAKVPEDIEE